MLKPVLRPADLPDFKRPPLNEVVLGVQFSNPVNYSQIHAGEVWNLFRAEYPNVEEHQPISPAFETFGPKTQTNLGGQFAFIEGPLHDRYWFLNQSRDELIQFQQDRLHHNWRKVGDESNEYPRFECMISKFTDELSKLEGYFNDLAPQSLQVNQCEVSYINHFPVENDTDIRMSDWLRFINFDGIQPQNFAFNFREALLDDANKPWARLSCEVSEGRKVSGQRIIALTLTVRGAPTIPDAKSALEFLSKGRNLIVKRFAELTTDTAHEKWGRSK
ncbi:MAG: TIGR04255 family protein [Telluria sp.]